jgi:hypothetical protein
LPQTERRKARAVVQTLRVARVILARRGGKTREATVILAWEASPPAGEKPIEWLLLTNERIDSMAAACLRIDWYRRRWLIEIFFRILKSGCQVETLRLGTLERLERGWCFT